MNLQTCCCSLQLRLVHIRVALLPHQILILPILLLKPIVVLIEGVVWGWRCCTFQRPVQQAASGNPTSKRCSSVGVLSGGILLRWGEVNQGVLLPVLLLQVWHRLVGERSLAVVPPRGRSVRNRHLLLLLLRLLLKPSW